MYPQDIQNSQNSTIRKQTVKTGKRFEDMYMGNHVRSCMAYSPITSWRVDGEIMERVRDFIFLGSKITVDGDCSHEIKRHLLLGRKAMTKKS